MIAGISVTRKPLSAHTHILERACHVHAMLTTEQLKRKKSLRNTRGVEMPVNPKQWADVEKLLNENWSAIVPPRSKGGAAYHNHIDAIDRFDFVFGRGNWDHRVIESKVIRSYDTPEGKHAVEAIAIVEITIHVLDRNNEVQHFTRVGCTGSKQEGRGSEAKANYAHVIGAAESRARTRAMGMFGNGTGRMDWRNEDEIEYEEPVAPVGPEYVLGYEPKDGLPGILSVSHRDAAPKKGEKDYDEWLTATKGFMARLTEASNDVGHPIQWPRPTHPEDNQGFAWFLHRREIIDGMTPDGERPSWSNSRLPADVIRSITARMMDLLDEYIRESDFLEPVKPETPSAEELDPNKSLAEQIDKIVRAGGHSSSGFQHWLFIRGHMGISDFTQVPNDNLREIFARLGDLLQEFQNDPVDPVRPNPTGR